MWGTVFKPGFIVTVFLFVRGINAYVSTGMFYVSLNCTCVWFWLR